MFLQVTRRKKIKVLANFAWRINEGLKWLVYRKLNINLNLSW